MRFPAERRLSRLMTTPGHDQHAARTDRSLKTMITLICSALEFLYFDCACDEAPQLVVWTGLARHGKIACLLCGMCFMP